MAAGKNDNNDVKDPWEQTQRLHEGTIQHNVPEEEIDAPNRPLNDKLIMPDNSYIIYSRNYPHREQNTIIYKNEAGKVHRDGDMPAVMSFTEDHRPTTAVWYKNGVIHREPLEDGTPQPAWLSNELSAKKYFDENGKMIRVDRYERRSSEGQEKGLEGIENFWNGTFLRMREYVKDEEDGPLTHNLCGPAIVRYNEIGDVIESEYYIDGEELKDKDEWGAKRGKAGYRAHVTCASKERSNNQGGKKRRTKRKTKKRKRRTKRKVNKIRKTKKHR